jgi:Ser/Thr protein kinase RdoA (MazF antagonist)
VGEITIPGPASIASGALRIPRPGRVLDIVRARCSTPSIDRHTAGSVLERYGLLATGRVQGLPSGWRNRSVTLNTSAGRKVLKRYRDEWAVEAIEHEHSILRHLVTTRCPTVRLEATASGETLVEREGARFALFAFEEGVNLAGYVLPRVRRARLWWEVGRLLAMFHRAMDGFVPEGRHHLGFRGSSDVRSRDLAWHLRALGELAVAEPRDAGRRDDVAWLRGNAGRIADRITTLDGSLTGAPLTRSVIHGDHGIHNVIVKKDGTIVLHDFELSRLDWRLIDLVIVMSRVELRDGRTFLDGYDAAAGSPVGERRFLPEVWEHYRLCGAVQSWSTYERLGDDRRLATARARIEEADRISERGPWVGGR